MEKEKKILTIWLIEGLIHLKSPTEVQAAYKQHTGSTQPAENGQNVFYIHAGSDNQEIPPEFRAFSLKNGMAFVAGNQENIMRNLGELLERKNHTQYETRPNKYSRKRKDWLACNSDMGMPAQESARRNAEPA